MGEPSSALANIGVARDATPTIRINILTTLFILYSWVRIPWERESSLAELYTAANKCQGKFIGQGFKLGDVLAR
jgi:hypothetical protein